MRTDEAALAIRDRARRAGHASVVLELTGDPGCARTVAAACEALGPANVVGVAMPADDRADDVRELALRTGLDYREEPVQPVIDGFLANLSLTGEVATALRARVRAVVLAAIAEQEGHLVLDPHDLSL